ncbi:hypothetical protein [Acrocarpospora sp. B8E8]|uniref:hypothetical protein n=1 Tax=Acrocarpospora sp. B8E8 TaxID=3153572 RepID=UPI00325D1E97
MPDALSLKRFLAELDSLLSPLDEKKLRSVFTGYASGLPASARTEFLGHLRGLCASAPPAQQRDADLIAEIESFIAAVESGKYYDGWGWDPELRHERAFGDESWVPRMDTLFTGAATAFLDSRHDLSAAAHRLLFGALALDGDEPVFSYEFSPAESLTTDLVEAGARWLRSLYELAADPGEAAEVMAETWLELLPHGARPSSLLAVRETLPTEPANLEVFYPRWSQELVERSGGHDPLCGRLLREVATATGNVNALIEAARKPGLGQPHAYLDLVDALRDHGDEEAALDICREGLGLLSGGDRSGWTAYQWAPLAETAADLAYGKEAVEFRIQAFTLATSTRRLVALHRAAEAQHSGSGGQVAGEAADRLAAGAPGLAHHHLANFRAQALLLAGRVDDALSLLPTANAVANGAANTTLTVLPYVLAASCGAVAHRDWENTVLHAMLAATADAGHSVFYGDDYRADDAETLSHLLERALREQISTAPERTAWLRTAHGVIDRWIRTTLNGKQRALYGDAARLAAALTETGIILDGESVYLGGVIDTYRRYVAFRREADKVRRESVLL